MEFDGIFVQEREEYIQTLKQTIAKNNEVLEQQELRIKNVSVHLYKRIPLYHPFSLFVSDLCTNSQELLNQLL